MRHGFSLVELSIVLVILGLLTGGILTGQNLIRASELRAVTTEYSAFQTAVNTFKDKYFALPGDMANATAFWGAAHATPATCLTTAGTGTQTCDGDGDGTLGSPAAASARGEMFMFWQHLANAGLIEGSYNGMAGSGGANHAVLGTNAPRPKMNNAGWSILYYGVSPGTVDLYALDYGNALFFGTPVANSSTYGALLKPEEAWNIDTKIDDGKPARGKVIARNWNNLCSAADDGTHANNDLAASYKLSDSTVRCALYFIKAF